MTLGERIQERLKEIGLSQSELARRVGLSQPAIHALIHKNKSGTRNLPALARELRTSIAYLTGESDDPSEGAATPPTLRDIAEHLDLVEIAEIDQHYGMGGMFADGHVEQRSHHFPRLWVESITSSPAALLTITRGKGDSMDPTIRDRDMVLLDRSQRQVAEQDAIWAFTVGDIGMIKRLRVRGERVTILSDNPSVPPDEAMADEINIIARVIFVGRRL